MNKRQNYILGECINMSKEYVELMNRLQKASENVGEGFNKLLENVGDKLDRKFKDVDITINKNNINDITYNLCDCMLNDTIAIYNEMKNDGVVFKDKSHFINFLNELVSALEELPEEVRNELVYVPRVSDEIKSDFIRIYIQKIKEIFIRRLEKEL